MAGGLDVPPEVAVRGGVLVAPLMGGEVADQGANLTGPGGQFPFEVRDTFRTYIPVVYSTRSS